MCLPAINGKPGLSVIMTDIYGRPCFQVFCFAMDWLFSEKDVPLIKLFHSNCLHLLLHKHLKVPLFHPKSQPYFPPLPIFPRINHQSCLLPKSFLPFSPGSYFFTWHFSVTCYYRNDTGKFVIAIILYYIYIIARYWCLAKQVW